MPNHAVSGRQTRAAVGESLRALMGHAQAIQLLGNGLTAVEDRVKELEALRSRGFLGRLKLVVFGR